MCTTHDKIGEIADAMRANPERYSDFIYYPGMPYAHKYANAVSELGVMETLKQFAPGGVMETVLRGAKSAMRKDADDLMRMLVDAEMKRFAGLKTPVIFLQNVVTDLLLGLGNARHVQDVLRPRAGHLRRRGRVLHHESPVARRRAREGRRGSARSSVATTTRSASA